MGVGAARGKETEHERRLEHVHWPLRYMATDAAWGATPCVGPLIWMPRCARDIGAPTGMEKKHRIYSMSFASVYPLYVQKAEKKGRTKQEVDEVITWLTGYRAEQLAQAIEAKVDFETFFAEAPRLNPNVGLITGVVCGVRVEDVPDPLMQKIRYLDKLVDELAKGKKLASILRG